METFGIDLKPALEKLYGQLPSDGALVKLKGDASTRSYYRFESKESRPPSLIVMFLPEDALKSDEATSGAKAAELSFLNVQRMLESRGLPVPRVLVDDVARRVVLLEDLGNDTFEARLEQTTRSQWVLQYESAVDLLANLHARCEPASTDCIAFTRRFDEKLLRWELDHFREWGLEAVHGALDARDRKMLDDAFDAIARELAGAETGFVHRDFQSRNLMWRRGVSTNAPELVVIDFQDALIGPAPYDLVALLCDSYVSLAPGEQDHLIARYLERRGLEGDRARAFTSTFWLQAVQRKLKDAGRFVFIDRVRKNPGFLAWYPQSLVYVGRALGHRPELEPVQALLARTIPGFPNDVGVPDAEAPQAGAANAAV